MCRLINRSAIAAARPDGGRLPFRQPPVALDDERIDGRFHRRKRGCQAVAGRFVGDLGGPFLDVLGGLTQAFLTPLFKAVRVGLATDGLDIRISLLQHLANLPANVLQVRLAALHAGRRS